MEQNIVDTTVTTRCVVVSRFTFLRCWSGWGKAQDDKVDPKHQPVLVLGMPRTFLGDKLKSSTELLYDKGTLGL